MTTVYVDMVGDLFHRGHVEFLSKARALGDVLVVGLHSDDDCEWFKRRPVLTLDERVAVVAECTFVDRVIPAAPVMTSRSWLSDNDVDLVVHGDDLSVADLEYWYRVPIQLGIFRTVPYSHGISSSSIAERVTRSDPEPRRAPTQDARPWTRRAAGAALARVPVADRAFRRRRFVHGLRRLHDALAGSPIDGRYWIWGGVLLGWARDGRVLDHDLDDADFAYADEDHERFLESVACLVRAGFGPMRRFSSGDGRYVEHVLSNGSARFEFFRLTPHADRWRYSVFSHDLGVDQQAEVFSEHLAEITAQPLVPCSFLGRTWQTVADHDALLTENYGDWRTPDPDHHFTEDRAIVQRRGIPALPQTWDWPTAVAVGPGDRGPPLLEV